jgi:hypothetical protein
VAARGLGKAFRLTDRFLRVVPSDGLQLAISNAPQGFSSACVNTANQASGGVHWFGCAWEKADPVVKLSGVDPLISADLSQAVFVQIKANTTWIVQAVKALGWQIDDSWKCGYHVFWMLIICAACQTM